MTNQGTLAAENIILKAMLPDQLEFISFDGPTDATPEGQTVMTAPLAVLDPKDKVVYRLKVKTVGTGDIRFRLDLITDQSPVAVEESESTNIYE